RVRSARRNRSSTRSRARWACDRAHHDRLTTRGLEQRMTTRLNILWASCVMLGALAHVASAEPGGAIVVEAYEGEVPADAAALLKPMYEELNKRGFVTQDKLGALIDHAVSRSAGQLSASQSAEAQRLVEEGFEHFIDGDYAKALVSEQSALALYQAAPA